MKKNDDDEMPVLPPSFRLRPSRNQKQRSKLKQVPEAAPAPDEAAPSPSAPAPLSIPLPAPALKKSRLKRSGHMHEDLTAPLPEEPPKKTTEY